MLGVIVVAATTSTELLAWAAASMVIDPPVGGLGGAVKRIGTAFGHPSTVVAVTAGVGGRLGICGGGGICGVTVKKPQPLAHTCQSMPALVESPWTAAFR